MGYQGTDRSGSDFATLMFLASVAFILLDALPRPMGSVIPGLVIAAFLIRGIMQSINRRDSPQPPKQTPDAS